MSEHAPRGTDDFRPESAIRPDSGPLPEETWRTRSAVSTGACERCGAPFEATRKGRRFCSEACRSAAEKARWLARKRAAARGPVPVMVCLDCGSTRCTILDARGELESGSPSVEPTEGPPLGGAS